MTSPFRPLAALTAAVVLPLSALAVTGVSTASPSTATPSTATTTSVHPDAHAFHRLATYPVLGNVPAGVDPALPTVAEISDVSDDGRTVAYTDALGKRVGFLDITDPARPVGKGSINLAVAGHADDQPTSVAIHGEHLLVVVDTSGGDFTHPSGRLDVYRLADRTKVREIDLGGQPDSIAISPDGTFATVAIENQRDEEFKPAGGKKGDLPQLPAGFLQVLRVSGDPSGWSTQPVPLTAPDGSALPALTAAGLDSAVDPEPEYVSINTENQLAVTLQENNGILVVDLPTGEIRRVFSAGRATVTGVDTSKDGLFNPTGTVSGPREPDAVAWVGTDRLATANEGDWKGGTRGWTVFDATSGEVVWDAGNSFERIATRHGLHNNDRAAKKGAEPEGISVVEIGGKRRAFVGSERSNFVAVYDLTDPARPRFEQALPTTNGPEGLLPVPSRDLLVVSSETDDAAKNVRASVSLFGWQKGAPAFPSVVSDDVPGSTGEPIGWGALGALSAAPGRPDVVYAASDSAYATGRIYTVETSTTPAVIESVLTVTEDGATPAIDIEGLAARPDGGFWAAVEGTTGPGNQLVRLEADGRVAERVALPAEVTAHVGKWGLEGVTSTGTGAAEVVTVVLQRPLFTDPANPAGGTVDGEGVARIGRYVPATGAWTWFGYQLGATSTPGDWTGLSEVTHVDADTVAVIERDKLNGPAAAVKQIHTVDLPTTGGATGAAPVRVLEKKLALDVLPALRASAGWTQEKLEGLTVTGGGQVLAVTDNDGLVDATGETQLLRLGSRAQVFGAEMVTPPAATATRTVLKASKKKVRAGKKVRLSVRVAGVGGGRVVVKDRGTVLRSLRLDSSGRAVATLRLKKTGVHRLRAFFAGNATAKDSSSAPVKVRVLRRR